MSFIRNILAHSIPKENDAVKQALYHWQHCFSIPMQKNMVYN